MDINLWTLIIKGALCGIIISGSIGPVLLLSLQCTLKKRWYHGFASGMGATVADTIYCAFAMMSLSFVFDTVHEHFIVFKSISAVVLIATGIYMYLSHKKAPKIDIEHMGIIKEFVQTFILGISNPMTMAGIVFVASLLGGLDPKSHKINSVLFVVSFLSGATLWWLLISLAVTHFKRFISNRLITTFSHSSGIAVVCIGLFMLFSLFFRPSIH